MFAKGKYSNTFDPALIKELFGSLAKFKHYANERLIEIKAHRNELGVEKDSLYLE